MLFHECVMYWVFQEDFNGVYRVFFTFQVASMVLQFKDLPRVTPVSFKVALKVYLLCLM